MKWLIAELGGEAHSQLSQAGQGLALVPHGFTLVAVTKDSLWSPLQVKCPLPSPSFSRNRDARA